MSRFLENRIVRGVVGLVIAACIGTPHVVFAEVQSSADGRVEGWRNYVVKGRLTMRNRVEVYFSAIDFIDSAFVFLPLESKERVSVSATQVLAVEVQTASHVLDGALIGAAVGLLMHSTAQPETDPDTPAAHLEAAVFSMTFFGLIGAVIGKQLKAYETVYPIRK